MKLQWDNTSRLIAGIVFGGFETTNRLMKNTIQVWRKLGLSKKRVKIAYE
jgi:hypothetical protein